MKNQSKIVMSQLAKNLPFSPYLFVGLVGISIFIAVCEPMFLSARNLINIPLQASILGLAAVGQTFCILGKGFDLSVGSMLALIGVIGVRYIIGGGNPYLAWLMMMGLGVCLGFLNGILIAKLKISPFIVTLSTMAIFRGSALVITGGKTLIGWGKAWDMYILPGYGNIGPIPAPVIITAIVFFIAIIALHKTPLGRHIYAVGGNEEAAEVSGINTDRVKMAMWSISGLCVGVAAIVLTGRLNCAVASLGVGLEFSTIAAVVIGGTSLYGGIGGVEGTIMGTIIIAVINNGLTMMRVSAFYVQIVRGIIILVAVLIDTLRMRKK